jgi:hypothetical protein
VAARRSQFECVAKSCQVFSVSKEAFDTESCQEYQRT